MSASHKLLIAASAAATLAVASTATAQSTQLTHRAGVSIPSDIAVPTVADAHQLAEEGRLKNAEQAYRAIIERQRAAREYPVEALKGLAFTQFARNDQYGAASTLEELAAAAGEFGDPETQLNALFQSALMFQELGDKRRASAHVPKIRSLLKSPVIPADVRDGIAKRIA